MIIQFGIGDSSEELAKKSEKLSKPQKLAKSRKKSSKSENTTNFSTKKAGPSFLTPNSRTIFNILQLAFTKTLILWHFDPEYYIWIENNISGYLIGDMLSQLASATKPKGVVTKINWDQWHPVAFFLRKMISVKI